MAEFDKKIATEAEFYEILKPFDDVPSEISTGICLRKGKIPKYTEKTFDALNSYKHNQLVPLATFIDVGNADYVLFSFIWEGDGDLDCVVKTSNFDEDYIGIGYGASNGYRGFRPEEIIQWSGDMTSSGGEYFLIDMKKLKEYKIKYGLANKYFDFDLYAHWYVKPQDISKNITLKIESIIADDAKKVFKKRFNFTNENVTNVFEYNFSTKASFDGSSGEVFFYDLVKRIRCFESFATFLPINLPTIESLEKIIKPPTIIVNGINNSPTIVYNEYNIFNIKQGDKIKITLYQDIFKKIVKYKNSEEATLFKHIEIKNIGSFDVPSPSILTYDYKIADNGAEMTIDINVIDLSNVSKANINFYFLGRQISFNLYKKVSN